MPVDGFKIGKHPLVSRLIKGAFHLRPPQSRYTGRWDVKEVLIYLKSKGEKFVKDVTHKLAMLMALSNADRASDLCALDIRYLSLSSEGASFRLAALTKSARPDRQITSSYSCLEDESLCPVSTLKLYLKRSATWRDGTDNNQLFLSINKPHHPVTPATIARWLKEVLKGAGVAENFSAHST